MILVVWSPASFSAINLLITATMNPEGFLPQKPLPDFVVGMGQAVANAVKLSTGAL